MIFKSFIYSGVLHHRRTRPKVHDFQYEVVMFYLDLEEIDQIFNIPFLFSSRAPSLIGFRRSDYFRKETPELKKAVQDLIFEKTGEIHDGSICLLTQIRYFGFCFNPVSFYYCFDKSEKLQFIVSEITNTPWNERHAYVLRFSPDQENTEFKFKKDFHVSPFLPMDLNYVWSLNQPKPLDKAGRLMVHMEDWDLKKQERVFEANLVLKPTLLTRRNLLSVLLTFPFLTLKTFFAIYYQALQLKLKRVPFYSHPTPGEKS